MLFDYFFVTLTFQQVYTLDNISSVYREIMPMASLFEIS